MIRSLRHHRFCILDTAKLGKTHAHRVRFNKAVFISTRNGYLFVKNEKAGNNTARMSLQTLESGGTLRSGFKSQRRQTGPLLQPSDLKLARAGDLNALGLFRFAIVRNPYARVLSSYLNKIDKADRKQQRFKVRAGLDPHRPATFGEFLQAISECSPDQMDPHWCPQYENLYCDIIDYDRIIRVENYGPEFSEVTKLLFGKTQIVNVHKDENRAQDFVGDHFTPALKKIVNRIYERDFRDFGYHMN